MLQYEQGGKEGGNKMNKHLKIYLSIIGLVLFIGISNIIYARNVTGFNVSTNTNGTYTGYLKKTSNGGKWAVHFSNTSSQHKVWARMEDANGNWYGSVSEVTGGEKRLVATSAKKNVSYRMKTGRNVTAWSDGNVKIAGSWSPDEK